MRTDAIAERGFGVDENSEEIDSLQNKKGIQKK